MNALIEFEGTKIRVVGTSERPEWIAADVCSVLGIANPSDTLAKFKPTERGIANVYTPQGSEQGMRSLLLWLVMAATAFAELPKAIVTGPKEAPPGELCILDASQSSGLGYLWLLVNSEKSFLPVDSGIKCVFSTGTPGDYVFVLVVSGVNGNGGPAAATATHTLKIIGATPPPSPDPPPNPPVPVPTPGKVSAAILLYESESTSQEIQSLILKLREEKAPHLRVLDSHATQADSDQPMQIVVDALKFLGGKKLPRLIGLDSAGCSVADSDIKSLDDVKRLLASWGLK